MSDVFRQCLCCRVIYKSVPEVAVTKTMLNLRDTSCPNCHKADSEVVACKACSRPKKAWITSNAGDFYNVRLTCFRCQAESVSNLLQATKS